MNGRVDWKPVTADPDYGPGGWNALHRDLYGDLVFPLQVVVGPDDPGTDDSAWAFVVVGHRMRAQSRATTARIGQGGALIFHDAA